MIAVLDTNVIISALYSKKGASYQLLRGAISGTLRYALSPLLILEYEGVIHRKIEEGFLEISLPDCEKILDVISSFAIIVWEPLILRPVLPDPSDDKILECAISGNCTHVITFNKKHFPEEIFKFYGINILTPGEFLKTWREKS
jgi:putative PIN family toxin of toxin-antitoxin system